MAFGDTPRWALAYLIMLPMRGFVAVGRCIKSLSRGGSLMLQGCTGCFYDWLVAVMGG